MTSYTTNGKYPYPDPTDAVTDYPATAATFAGYVDNLPNKNVLINGLFDCWQRGFSFSNPASGTYTADRWIFTHNGTGGTRTIARSAVATGTSFGGMQPRQMLQLNVTNAGSPAATSQTIGQRVEDVRTLAGEKVTFSAWINNGATGITSATVKAIQNFGTGGTPSTAVTTTLGTISISSTWTRVSITTTLPTLTSKTIGSNENSYVEIQIDIGGATGSIFVWGVQVEQNTTATALERRPIQQELALCQRYFRAWTNSPTHMCVFYSADTAASVIKLDPPMRSAPLIAYSGSVVIDIPAAGSFTGTAIINWISPSSDHYAVLVQGFSGRTVWSSGILKTAHSLSAEL